MAPDWLSGAIRAASSRASLALGMARFGFRLQALLREPLTVQAAEATLRRGIARRTEVFLELLTRAVFGQPRSPYLALLRSAGCELGDIRVMVHTGGLEAALERLRAAGVFVTHAELKGRAVAVRGSQGFVFREEDFDNPLVRPQFTSATGGSWGRPARIKVDLEHVAQSAPHWALWLDMHGLLRAPLVFLTPYYPGIVNRHLICAKFGNRFVKWFVTSSGGTFAYRLATAYVHGLARRRAGFPPPEWAPPQEAWRVTEYLARLLEKGERPCVNTSPSDAIRVCVAAAARGVALDGVTFLLGAEPVTAARRAAIVASGAKAVVTYGTSDAGTIGSQCIRPGEPDDVHVALDAYAVLQHHRDTGDGAPATPLLLTALRPACPKILINAEIGDVAVSERRQCGCRFDDLGFFQHLHTVRSFHALTGEGVTFLGLDIARLVEEELPKRFGGAPTDYQLVEEEDASGRPRYELLANPDLPGIDSERLRAVFLAELGRLGRPYRFMVDQWVRADVVRVVRHRPIVTGRGKVLPYRTLGARGGRVD